MYLLTAVSRGEKDGVEGGEEERSGVEGTENHKDDVRKW